MPLASFILIAFVLLLNPLAYSSPINAGKLFDEPGYSRVKISPNGKFVSTYIRTDDEKLFHLIDVIDRSKSFSAKLGLDINVKDYLWISNEHIYFKVVYRGKTVSIFGTVENRKIIFNHSKTEGYVVDELSDVPDRVLFAKRRGESEYYDLYLVSIADFFDDNFGKASKINTDSSRVRYFGYDPIFDRIIASEYSEKNKNVTVSYMPRVGGKWKKLIVIKNEDYEFRPQSFIDDKKLYVITNKDTDKMVLREFDIATQTMEKIVYQHPKYDLTSARYLRNGQLHSVSFDEHGLNKRLYFDKGNQDFAIKVANTFKNQEAYFIAKTADEKLSLLYVNGSTQPGEYFLYESKYDRLQRLLVSYPDLVDTKFSPSELIITLSDDGTEIEAFLNLPQGYDHSTLLVMPHGGPIDVKDDDRFNKEVQYYASRGFAVLRVNFRGSSGFGKKFQDQGVGEFGRLIEADITTVVRKVRKKHHFVHMCSIGASYGGYSAAMLAIIHPDQYECVVGAFGIYDLPLLFNASNYRSGKKYRGLIAKTVGKYDLSMREYSPLYLYEDLKAPILLIAGKDDNTADFEHSNRFHYILKKAEHPVESMFYENTGHGHASWSGDRHEAAFTSEFLRTALKLEIPKPSQLTKQGKEAIADDYARIADGYEFKNNVANYEVKAQYNYERAADYDHPRAIYNLGAEYEDNDQSRKNLREAIEYYRLSAKLGYDGALRRLGQIYMEGEFLIQDWEKARKNLIKAQELNQTTKNNTMLARFYCVAPKPYKDISRCLELMNLKQFKSYSKANLTKALSILREELANIIIDSTLTEEESALIIKYIWDLLELNGTDVKIEDPRSGVFRFVEHETFGKSGKYEQIGFDAQFHYTEGKETRYGAIFKVDVPGINISGDNVAVAARWTHESDEDIVSNVYSVILYGSPSDQWTMLRKFKKTGAEGKWVLEIFDLHQTRIFKKEFYIVRE